MESTGGMEDWNLLLCQAHKCGKLGWYGATSGVCLFVDFSVGWAKASSRWRCLVWLYSGFITAMASEMFLQLCGSLLKVSSDEQMPESLAVGIASLQCLGSQLLVARYWWVFINKSVTTLPPSRFTFVSKKETLSLDRSTVNLIVGILLWSCSDFPLVPWFDVSPQTFSCCRLEVVQVWPYKNVCKDLLLHFLVTLQQCSHVYVAVSGV